MALKTRRPTGAVPWPLLLIEGEEKAGKTWAAAQFSACERTGQMYWIDLGEGGADEYGDISGTDYLIVEHDGTARSIAQGVADVAEEARRVAAAGEPPVVLVIDTISALWRLLSDQADERARRRDVNKAKLARDPDAEIVITPDLWNAATKRWRAVMDELMTFPGIVILLARGSEVAAVENGKPVEGKKVWRVEGQKHLAFDCSVWVRMRRGEAPHLIGARSVHAGIRPDEDKPRPLPGFTIERLVFDLLKCNPGRSRARDMTALSTAEDDVTITAGYARSLLGAACNQHGWDRKAVGARYQLRTGRPLSTEQDPAPIREFTATLVADPSILDTPDEDDRPPAAAGATDGDQPTSRTDHGSDVGRPPAYDERSDERPRSGAAARSAANARRRVPAAARGGAA